MEKNIPKYLAAFIIRDLWISMPIFILYLQFRNISFFQIGILEASIAIFIVIAEIPTGALADLIGNKRCTTLGLLSWMTGLWGMALSTEFYSMLISYLIIGLGEAFLSGASSALFYETLKNLGREEKILYYNGRMAVISAVMVIIGSLLGGYLFSLNEMWPFWAHGTVALIASIIVFSMKEPIKSTEPYSIKKNYSQIINSVDYTFKSPKVRFITVFSTLIFVPIMLFVNIMEQPYLLSIGYETAVLGIVYAFTRGVIGFASFYRYELEKKFGEKGSFFGIVIIYSISFLIMAFIISRWLVLLMMLLFFTRDFSRAILDKYTNDNIPSEKRATILSIVSFMSNFLYSIVSLIIGYLLSHQFFSNVEPINLVLIIFGTYCGIIVFPFLLFNYKNQQKKQEKQ